MKKETKAKNRWGILLCLVVLGLVAALLVLPNQFSSQAGSKVKVGKGLFQRTESHEEGLENYDIRDQKTDETYESLMKFRLESGKSAAAIADVRDNFVRGEDDLRTRVPSLKVEYNGDIHIPEIITPDVWKTNIDRLTDPAPGGKNAEKLRNFIKQNHNLVGMDIDQLDQLKVVADYTNPSGNMAFAYLNQEINGIPVFRGEVKAGFTTKGEIVRVVNNLAPGLDYESLSTDFRDPLDAVKAAFRNINAEPTKVDLQINNAASTDLKAVFGSGDWATTAEKMYFPIEPGVARTAWRVLIWQPVNAYYVIVDAETGTMLWRKNLTEDQTQSATYEVYVNPLSMVNAADSVAPLTPYVSANTSPADGAQGALLSRTNVTLIGNEGPLSFNDNGWITDGANGTDGFTDGNAVEAGVDLGTPNGVDAPVPGNGRVFSSAWNPPPGNPGPGDAPTVQAARDGAVIQMFYLMNRYHDALYQLGFNEMAFNFQDNNFGRGGAGADRVSAEGQDSSGTDNANFSTPADGGRGRMQMFVFTGTTPQRDGTADGDIVYHEVTHGTSNRLHGNASGLSTNMSRGMGEGWSDWYAFCLLSSSDDPVNGVYAGGGHVLLGGFGVIGSANYYYGIRRLPKATMATTGGPMNRPHNPMTFADIDQSQLDLTDAAFTAMSGPHISTSASQVHAAGEIWSSALWEVRALMITRLGHQAGNLRALQVVTDGMKLAPLGPTFLQERDAIISAASALPAAPEASADVADVREGFRIRGMGFSATVDACCGTTTTAVTEAFDFPNVVSVDPFSVSDSSGNNNGFPEPGENVLLSVAVENTTGGTITGVQVNANGGANVSYGDIPDGQTVTMNIPYLVPSDAPCGSFHQVDINVSSDAGTQTPVTREFRVGVPVGGAPATFSNTNPVDVPMGQPATTSGPASPYPSTISVSGLTGNKTISVTLNTINHTWVGDFDVLLESPGGQKFIMMSDVFEANNRTNTVVSTLTIRDGAAGLMPTGEVPPMTGDFQPTNAGTVQDAFDAPAPAGPYETPAPGGSATFASVFGNDSSTMNGDWKLWIDDDASGDPGVMTGGWSITFESDDFTCGPVMPTGDGRADFDGDGRTDVSVFRPSEGNWYINGSQAGFSVINWGTSGDTLVPGDYDGDGKADTAVFRPVDAPGTPDFFVLNSNGFTLSGAEWGVTGDVPVVGDYDGDGNDDIAIFRPSDNTWYILNSGGGATFTPFGSTGDTPVPGDYDGDGKTDIATFNAGTWNAMLSGGGTATVNVGGAGDIPVAGDYDGDGKDDQATFNTTSGTWNIWQSSTSSEVNTGWGLGTDTPAPGDYDGDGKDDLAIYRAGEWWILNSGNSSVTITTFGLGSDSPIPSHANP